MTTLLEAHGEEIKTLRTRYHDEIAPSLARLSVALEFIEQRMEDRRGSGA